MSQNRRNRKPQESPALFVRMVHIVAAGLEVRATNNHDPMIFMNLVPDERKKLEAEGFTKRDVMVPTHVFQGALKNGNAYQHQDGCVAYDPTTDSIRVSVWATKTTQVTRTFKSDVLRIALNDSRILRAVRRVDLALCEDDTDGLWQELEAVTRKYAQAQQPAPAPQPQEAPDKSGFKATVGDGEKARAQGDRKAKGKGQQPKPTLHQNGAGPAAKATKPAPAAPVATGTPATTPGAPSDNAKAVLDDLRQKYGLNEPTPPADEPPQAEATPPPAPEPPAEVPAEVEVSPTEAALSALAAGKQLTRRQIAALPQKEREAYLAKLRGKPAAAAAGSKA